MSKETSSNRPGLFTGIKRAIKSVLKFFLRPFKPYIVRIVRICIREDTYQLETLRKSIRDYENRSRKMADIAAEQERRLKKMQEQTRSQQEQIRSQQEQILSQQEQIFSQKEEIERLENACREEEVLRLSETERCSRETERLEKLKTLLDQVRKNYASEHERECLSVRTPERRDKKAA